MKIKITRRTNIKGNVVNVGDVIDCKYADAKDVSTLLKCGSAVEVADAPKETSKAEVAKVEVADAKPKKMKKR